MYLTQTWTSLRYLVGQSYDLVSPAIGIYPGSRCGRRAHAEA